MIVQKFVLFSVLFLFISGCSTIEQWRQQWLAENCNLTSAYSNGLSDGLKPETLPNNYGNSCPVHQSEISAAYLRGFTKGLEGRPKEININQTVHNHKKHGKKKNDHYES